MITHYNNHLSEPTEYTWKMIVFDEHCQNIIAPLFSLYELRELGVTLTMWVIVIYFILYVFVI